MRSPGIRTIFTSFEAFYHRKPILFHLRIINFIAYALKRIQKKLINKSEKCVLLGYKEESIYRLYNLIKKKIIRVNSVHFVKKRPLFVNPEEETEAYEHSAKRQRLTVVSVSATKETLNEQRITDVSEDVTLIIPRIAPNPRSTVTLATLRVISNPRPITSIVAEFSTNLRPNFL